MEYYDDNKDHVYCELTVENDIGATSLKPCEYNETRTKSIIRDPSEYKLAVESFYLSTNAFALFEFKVGDYIITVEDIFGTDYQQIVQPPVGPVFPAIPDKKFIFDVYTFLDLVNESLQTLYTTGGFAFNAPFLYFDSSYKLIQFYKDVNDTNRIWFNSPLGFYFQNLHIDFSNITFNSINGKDVEILWDNPYQINTRNIGGNDFILNQDSFQRVNENWFNISKVYITSRTLNCRDYHIGFETLNEERPAGLPYELNVIASFFVSRFNNPTEPIVFNLPNNTNYSDILSNTPLIRLDFQIFVQTYSGDLFLVNLIPGSVCSLRLHFTKKDFLTSN